MTTLNQKHLRDRLKGMPSFDIVIPHHNRADHLKNCLESIPLGINVFVVRGGTFAENCNKGFRMGKSNRVLFLNDDTILSEQIIYEFAKSTGLIVGAKFVRGDGTFLTNGVKINPWHEGGYYKFNSVRDIKDADFPGGGAILVERTTFCKLGMFNEEYRNGAEDVEFFFRAMELGIQFNYIRTQIIHHHSQSLDRLKYSKENLEILKNRFPIRRVELLIEKEKQK